MAKATYSFKVHNYMNVQWIAGLFECSVLCDRKFMVGKV